MVILDNLYMAGWMFHKSLLQVSHNFLPNGSLHGQMSLNMFDILLGQCFTVSRVFCQAVAIISPAFFPLFVFLHGHSLLLILAGADGHGAVCLWFLEVEWSFLVELVISPWPLTGRSSLSPLRVLFVEPGGPAVLLVLHPVNQARQGNPSLGRYRGVRSS